MFGVLLNWAQCVSGKQTQGPWCYSSAAVSVPVVLQEIVRSCQCASGCAQQQEGNSCCNSPQIILLCGELDAHMIRDCASSEGEVQLLAGNQWLSKTFWHNHAQHICHNLSLPSYKTNRFFRPIPVFPTKSWLSMRCHKPLKWFSGIIVHEGWVPRCCCSKNNASPALAEIR